MPVTTSSPLVSELGTERRIVICAALALTLLSLVFRNDRALLLGPAGPADRDASAFTAVVAPPMASGSSIPRFTGPLANIRRPGTRVPVRGGGAPAFTPNFVAPAPAPGAPAGAAVDTPTPGLPTQVASISGPARSYTPQMASFIGLPGGVIFGSGGTAPTDPVDPTTPTTPTDPVTPPNPVDPTDPVTPPITTPDPGPGAVPEPVTWALMILGIGMVGGSLRRRRAAETGRAGLAAA